MAMDMEPKDGPLTGLDYRYYLDVLWQGKWTIAAGVVLCVGIAFISGILRKPQYRAEATVSVDMPPPQVDPTSAVVQQPASSWFDYQTYYPTQMKVIGSNIVLERAANDILQQPQYRNRNKGEIIAALGASVVPALEADTRLIHIRVTRESPDEAALWANMVAKAYSDNNVEATRKSFQEAMEALETLIERNQANRTQAAEKLQAALRDYGIAQMQESPRPDTGPLQMANQSLLQAQKERESLEHRYQVAVGSKQSPEKMAQFLIRDFGLGQLLQEKLKLDQETQELKRKGFLDRNPQIVDRTSRLASLDEQIGTAVESGIAALRSELEDAVAKEEQAKKVRDAEQQKIQSASTDPKVLDNVIQQAITGQIAGDLQQVRNRIELSKSLLNKNNIALVQKAFPPDVPINQQSPKVLLLGLFGGLFLGIGLVVAKDYVDNTIRDSEEIERVLGLPHIGEIPRSSEGSEFARREAYNALWTNIKFSTGGGGSQAILVTSTMLEEGKTTVSADLGRTAAMLGGRTLIIDFDLRRPMLHKRFAIPRERTNKTSAILIVDDEEYIRRMLVENMRGYLTPMGRDKLKSPVGRILTASDAGGALEIVREEEIALAIVDINLPGVNGIELLGRIKEQRPETQVIMITGYASMETAIEAVRRGACEYLIKPFELKALGGAISKALDKWMLLVENKNVLKEITNSEGLAAYLAGDAELDSIICPTDTPNLWLIPAGTPPQNPFALINRGVLGDLIKTVKQQFDLVILDSPPVASVSDPTIIASVADAVLLVVRHNRTDRKLIRRTVKLIQRANERILGVVLNDIHAAKHRYYRYRYHYGYYASEPEEAKTPSASGRVKKLFSNKSRHR
jgi:capsular exopolysaccharide synthesis family protein